MEECGDGIGAGKERRTFGVFEMNDVDAGMVSSVVADVAEVWTAVGVVSVGEGERESGRAGE